MDKIRSFIWRPHTSLLIIGVLVPILIWVSVSFMITNFKPTASVRLGTSTYSLWLANTEPARVQGLSGVKSLKPNQGLLMEFDSDNLHGIWMKDMNFPLDILWLDSHKKVIYIVKNAPPEVPATTIFAPETPARYVIELPAGSVQKAAIKTGEIAEFTIES